LAIEVQWPKLARSGRLLKFGALRRPLLLMAVGPVIAASTYPAAAAPTGKLCSVEASFVNEKIWILPQLGRLAPDGSSALGEIPGHGKVTAILWDTAIPVNNRLVPLFYTKAEPKYAI
jgi:hypothetical protein